MAVVAICRSPSLLLYCSLSGNVTRTNRQVTGSLSFASCLTLSSSLRLWDRKDLFSTYCFPVLYSKVQILVEETRERISTSHQSMQTCPLFPSSSLQHAASMELPPLTWLLWVWQPHLLTELQDSSLCAIYPGISGPPHCWEKTEKMKQQGHLHSALQRHTPWLSQRCHTLGRH